MDFPTLIEIAPTWLAASDVYMEARNKLSRSSAEWGKCVLAMYHRSEDKAYKHGPEHNEMERA